MQPEKDWQAAQHEGEGPTVRPSPLKQLLERPSLSQRVTKINHFFFQLGGP
jgi:hypothetical protein